jgi:TonB family protein
MLLVNRWIFCVISALASAAALAQAAPTPPEVDESKIPDWVKRQARSPYKIIIESNTVRAKPAAAKGDDGGAKPAPKRVATTAAPAAPNPGPASTADAAVTPMAVTAEPITEDPGQPARVEASTAALLPVPVPELAAVAALAPSATPAPDPASPPAVATVATRQAPPLQLVSRVEPVIPLDLVDDRLNSANVVVGFTVNADGEVVNPSVTSTSDPRLNRSVLRAVRSWRYAPIEAPRQHAVRFEFTTQ